MAAKGICEICGFADDSYRIEENGAVMKVCKFCHDGYVERTKAAESEDSAKAAASLPFDDIPPDDLEKIERELEQQKKERKVPTLDLSELDKVLAPTDDDKRVLSNVRRRQIRAEKKAAATGGQVAWEDIEEEEPEEEENIPPAVLHGIDDGKDKKKKPKKPSRAEKNIEKIRAEAAEQQKLLRTRIQGILDTLEIDGVLDDDGEESSRLVSAIGGEKTETESEATASAQDSPEQAVRADEIKSEVQEEKRETGKAEDAEENSAEAQTEESDETSVTEDGQSAPVSEESIDMPAAADEMENTALSPDESEDGQAPPIQEESIDTPAAADETVTEALPSDESEDVPTARRENEMAKKKEKRDMVREKIYAAANQTIDDERIKITSPEIALSKDERPKTNLDVAASEYAGGVRFFDAFKYVMHRVSYTVFIALIVIAVATVMFVKYDWQHALITLGGGVGAVGLGFLLMWYLSHCYELDRRALLLRIRQQEILFESMDTDCYRELRTKFTMLKALGWLLNKLSVLLPLIIVIGGNAAAVIAGFKTAYYWLFPVVSAAASLAAVIVYYITKFAADLVAYKLDRERNQQIQQQTLLDILAELRKNK